MFAKTLAAPCAAACLLLGASSFAGADTTVYQFAGSYNTVISGRYVSLPYSGSFSISDPALTPIRPPEAADVGSGAYTGIWAGNSSFYSGAGALSLSFANSASASAAGLGLVVNNTTLAGPGSPYPLGLSVQMYPVDLQLRGMSVGMVCPDGSTDEACDASGEDPIYQSGDEADQAVRQITGLYFAFWHAPLSTVEAGVPNLASSFGPTQGGLGVRSINSLGQSVTTLTQFSQLDATVISSPVPESSSHVLLLLGLAGLAWLKGPAARARVRQA